MPTSAATKSLLNTLLIALLLLASLAACSESPPLRLTAKQREVVDSMYVDSVKVLNEVMEERCSARFARELPGLIDSIIEVRLEEEARLREKYSRQ